MDFLSSHKSIIDIQLSHFFSQKEKKIILINRWGSDAIKKLSRFTVSGKTIRGSLVLYSYSLFQKEIGQPVLAAAAALEIIHSGFLIHDDIMDKDTIRRGHPSMHMQYAKFRDEHFGTSMGINLADLCFFLAYELIPAALTQYVSREWASVVVAQMQDVAGAKTQQELLSLYTYKTARYSFSVPFGVGARLASAPNEIILQLETLGEYLGVLYQIRDDELDNTKNALPDSIKNECLENANSLIDSLHIGNKQKKELVHLLSFCHNRQT